MAPAIGDITINIFPNDVTFSGTYTANSGVGNTTFDSSDFSVSGDYLVYAIRDVDVIGFLTITINGHSYSYETYAGKDTVTMYLGNWYAWTGYVDTQGGRTVTWYTLSATPSTGDSIYQTPPYLDSIVTTSTIISGDIDTYKFSQNPYITSASASSITIGGGPTK